MTEAHLQPRGCVPNSLSAQTTGRRVLMLTQTFSRCRPVRLTSRSPTGLGKALSPTAAHSCSLTDHFLHVLCSASQSMMWITEASNVVTSVPHLGLNMETGGKKTLF